MKLLTEILERFTPTMNAHEPLLPLTQPYLDNTKTQPLNGYNNNNNDVDPFDDYGAFDDDDDDDDDYENVYNTQTNDTEQAAIWNTEDEFAAYVYSCVQSERQCDIPYKHDFYYDMFKSIEHDPYLDQDVHVYWLPKKHPYSMMIRESNIEHYAHFQQNKYPIFAQYMNVVAYNEQYIDQAVISCLEMCKRLDYKIEDIEYAAPSPPPVIVEGNDDDDDDAVKETE